MLVLARRRGEEIIISGQIRVTVLEVHNDTVRLGIAAPAEVHIVRKEIADRPPDPAGADRLRHEPLPPQGRRRHFFRRRRHLEDKRGEQRPVFAAIG
jgi:carbon storage regulator